MIYCFTKTRDWKEWLDVQQKIFVLIAELIKAQGADIAFPTTTLDLPSELSIESSIK